jgi:hypothetical protein
MGSRVDFCDWSWLFIQYVFGLEYVLAFPSVATKTSFGVTVCFLDSCDIDQKLFVRAQQSRSISDFEAL